MKMRSVGTQIAPEASGNVLEVNAPKNVYRHQFANRLRALANEEYQLMVKIKMLANTLKKPAFTAIIDNADYFSDKIMGTLNHYAYHINVLEEGNANIPSIVQACEINEYAGWVDRVKEIIKFHVHIKEEIGDILLAFAEAEYPETFHFLKQQMVLHEDQMWHLRNQIDF